MMSHRWRSGSRSHFLASLGSSDRRLAIDCDDFSLAEQQRYGLVKKDDDCSVTSAQGLAAGYLALQKGSKPSGAYVLR